MSLPYRETVPGTNKRVMLRRDLRSFRGSSTGFLHPPGISFNVFALLAALMIWTGPFEDPRCRDLKPEMLVML